MKEPSQILAGLIAIVQEEGGEWFATAKDLQFYGLALELATGPPCGVLGTFRPKVTLIATAHAS